MLLMLTGAVHASSLGEAEPWPRTQDEVALADILTDSDGTTWVATTEGLYARTPVGRWVRYGEEAGIPTDLTDLALDPHGVLWLGGWKGLVGFDTHTHVILAGPPPEPGGQGHAAFVHALPSGDIWAAQGNGAVHRTPDGVWQPRANSYWIHKVNCAAAGCWALTGGGDLMRLAKDGARWNPTGIGSCYGSGVALAPDGSAWTSHSVFGVLPGRAAFEGIQPQGFRGLAVHVRTDGTSRTFDLGPDVHDVVQTEDGRVLLLGEGQLWEAVGEEVVSIALPAVVGDGRIWQIWTDLSGQLWIPAGDDVYRVRDGASASTVPAPPAFPGRGVRPVSDPARPGAFWLGLAEYGPDGRMLGLEDVRDWGHSPPGTRAVPDGWSEPVEDYALRETRYLTPSHAGGPWRPPGSAWMATNAGLMLLDLVSGARTQLKLPLPGVATLANGADGTLWVGAQGAVLRFDGATGQLRRYPLGELTPTTIGVSASGTVWAGAGDVLERLLPGHDAFAAVSGVRGVRKIAAEPSGRTWLLTTDGLFQLDGDTPVRVLDGDVRVAREAAGGGLWVGLHPGLALVHAHGSVERFDAYVPGYSVRDIFIDSRRRVWILGIGVSVRETDGRWLREGQPWQNGLAAACPFPVEREGAVPGSWEPANGVVPHGIRADFSRPASATSGDLVYTEFSLDSQWYRLPIEDWLPFAFGWLSPRSIARDAPWRRWIEAVWEDADGVRMADVGLNEGLRGWLGVFAEDAAGNWVSSGSSTRAMAVDVEPFPIPGGGAWLGSTDGSLLRITSDGAVSAEIEPDRRLPASSVIAATPHGVARASTTVAAAWLDGAWVGRRDRRDPARALAFNGSTRGVLTGTGRVLDLAHGWDAPSPLALSTDLVARGADLCVVGLGAACVTRRGVWSSIAVSGVFLDAATDGRVLWTAGLSRPTSPPSSMLQSLFSRPYPAPMKGTGLDAGVVCRLDRGWACIPTPATPRVVTPDGAGGVWVGTTRGLLHLDQADTLTATPIVNPVTHVALAAGSGVWVGVENVGLQAYWPADGLVETVSAGVVRALDAVGDQAWAAIETPDPGRILLLDPEVYALIAGPPAGR